MSTLPARSGSELEVGDEVEVVVGPVAHGGHCVARYDGRVLFVRHTLPGERVRVRVTEGGAGDRFLRADAVEVLEAAPGRVEPRCPFSGPGRCGGCDWQHADLATQRALKATVVREQLSRLGRVSDADLDALGLDVEAVPGDADGLSWRTRVQLAVDAEGHAGLRRHRSHDVVRIDDCPIAHPGTDVAGLVARRWPGVASVEVAAPAGGQERLLAVEQAVPTAKMPRDLPEGTSVVKISAGPPRTTERVRGRTWLRETVEASGWQGAFRVSGTGFWQVHPGAPAALVDAVLEALDPQPGEAALDLYAGAGLFTAALADRVGATGRVLAVESDKRAVADARRNLHEHPSVGIEQGRVERVLAGLVPQVATEGTVDVDLVVLDPPRTGAGRRVVELVTALRPRAVAYVACDPAALARDVAYAAEHGYRLTRVRGFDCFPMTHHVECVALLEKARSDLQ